MKNLDFIYNRKSVRKFKNEEVPKEDIIKILKKIWNNDINQ